MTHIHKPHMQNKAKKVKHNDWICSLCNNYNYSFRVSCSSSIYSGNRCHIQSRNNNICKDMHVNAKLANFIHYLDEPETSYEPFNINNFPNFLFFSLAEECPYE